MILNVEPGGCGAETARPASASTAPSLRAHDRDAAEARAQRGGRGALQARLDRGPHGLPALGLHRGDHAVAEAQLGARRAAEARVVDVVQALGQVGRGRVVGHRQAVGAEDRRARRLLQRAARAPPRPCAGRAAAAAASRRSRRDRPRCAPGTVVVPRSVPKYRVRTTVRAVTAPSFGPLGCPDRDPADHGRLRGAPRELGEARVRVGGPAAGVELGVHRALVAALVGGQVALGGRALVVDLGAMVEVEIGARADRTEHEQHDQPRPGRPCAPAATTAPAAAAARLEPGHAGPAGGARGGEHGAAAAAHPPFLADSSVSHAGHHRWNRRTLRSARVPMSPAGRPPCASRKASARAVSASGSGAVSSIHVSTHGPAARGLADPQHAALLGEVGQRGGLDQEVAARRRVPRRRSGCGASRPPAARRRAGRGRAAPAPGAAPATLVSGWWETTTTRRSPAAPQLGAEPARPARRSARRWSRRRGAPCRARSPARPCPASKA